MRRHAIRQLAGATLALALMALPACGEGDNDTDTDAQGGLSSEEVVALLVTAEDLGGRWKLTDPSGEGDEGEFDGTITDENRDLLPRLEFCELADDESQQTASGLTWQAFRQFALDLPQPTPGPGTKARPQTAVFVQEYLLSDDADAVQDTYESLAAGFEACADHTETTPDGEVSTSSALEVPELGDDAIGSRLTVRQPMPKGQSALWDLRNVLVRDGRLLVYVVFGDVSAPGGKTQLTDAEVEEILTTVADRLP